MRVCSCWQTLIHSTLMRTSSPSRRLRMRAISTSRRAAPFLGYAILGLVVGGTVHRVIVVTLLRESTTSHRRRRYLGAPHRARGHSRWAVPIGMATRRATGRHQSHNNTANDFPERCPVVSAVHHSQTLMNQRMPLPPGSPSLSLGGGTCGCGFVPTTSR